MSRALTEWQKELREGKRIPTTLDDLWRAACAAINAMNCLTSDAANQSKREADRLLKSYHQTKKRERNATRDGFEYL